MSKTWTTILAGENICKLGSRWLIGTNCTLNFWADTWLKLGNIHSLISGPLNFDEENLRINNIYERGFWNLHNLSFVLPLQLELLIKALPIRRDFEGVNSLVWNSSSKGDFDPKDAYRLALNPLSKPSVFTNNWIWKLNIIPKIQFFLWKCAHASLPVKSVLFHRHISADPLCDICHEREECMLHVLRDCPVARQFWADSGISHIDHFSSKCPARFGLKIMPIITLWFGLSRSHGACTSCLVFGIYGFFKTRLFFKVFLTTPFLSPLLKVWP